MNSANAGTASSPPVSVARYNREAVRIPINGIELRAELSVPAGAQGLVLFTVGCGSILETPRATLIARRIAASGTATLTFSLLTPDESQKDHYGGYWSFDLDLLTHRLLLATNWAMERPQTRDLGIGYIGTSTFAAAALVAAGQLGYAVQALVSRSGRPDFAGEWLPRVTASTLLIAGDADETVLELNRRAFDKLTCLKQLSVVPKAGHLFEEAGALEQVGELAANWFHTHLRAIKRN